MERVSDILKKELEEGHREWNEARFAIPVLTRILARLRAHRDDEAKDDQKTADALVLPIILLEHEIEKLKGTK